MRPFRVQRLGRNVHTVHVQASRQADWHFSVLLTGDRHIDNSDSDLDRQRRHLKQAADRGAGIIDVGDVFDAMQGRNDPRRQKGVGRQSAAVAAYLDEIVREASDFLTPFASNFIVIGRGNHETAVLKQNETDLTERLCERMSMISGTKVHAGGYGGWVRFVVRWGRKACARHNLHYFHGSGGGGLMTHGTLMTRRIASYTPDAHTIVSGHTHDNWVMTLSRQRLGATGKVYLDEQNHVRVPTYKDEFRDGYGGFHVERGAPPKPTGAWWMTLSWADRNSGRLRTDFSRAD